MSVLQQSTEKNKLHPSRTDCTALAEKQHSPSGMASRYRSATTVIAEEKDISADLDHQCQSVNCVQHRSSKYLYTVCVSL